SVVFAICLLMLALHYRQTNRDTRNHGFPPIRVVLLFAAAGLPFIVVLPGAAKMFYEARQLLPFAAIAVGVLGWTLVLSIGKLVRSDFAGDLLLSQPRSRAFALLFIMLALIGVKSAATVTSFPPAQELRRFNERMSRDVTLARELAKK